MHCGCPKLSRLLYFYGNVRLSLESDCWEWDLAVNGMFSIGATICHIYAFVPIKINVLMWRILLDGISIRVNLVNKGIDLSTSLCPLCD